MMSRTDSGELGTEGSLELPGCTTTVRPSGVQSGYVSSVAVSAFPASERVIVGRGAGVRSVEVPFDLGRERTYRENLIANRGEDPQSSTADG